MSASCQSEFSGNNTAFKRVLLIVIAINACLFIIEMVAGFASHSQALKADALDFLADSLTYAITLWAVNKPLDTRNKVARIKAYSLLLMAVWILLASVYRLFFSLEPEVLTMTSVAILALIANLVSVLLLMKFRNGDANIRSVWVCSRNDMINNIFVLIAAGLVFLTGAAWPDLIAALIMSSLFILSAIEIIKQSNSSCSDRSDD